MFYANFSGNLRYKTKNYETRDNYEQITENWFIHQIEKLEKI
jgi:hypothetical protein